MEKRTLDPIPEKCPKWAAASFYDREKDELYLPAVIGGDSEQAVLLCLSFDGVPVVHDGGHLYAPLSWLEREYPKCRETFEAIKLKHRVV